MLVHDEVIDLMNRLTAAEQARALASESLSYANAQIAQLRNEVLDEVEHAQRTATALLTIADTICAEADQIFTPGAMYWPWGDGAVRKAQAERLRTLADRSRTAARLSQAPGPTTSRLQLAIATMQEGIRLLAETIGQHPKLSDRDTIKARLRFIADQYEKETA